MPADLSAYFCPTDQLTVQMHLRSHLRSHSNSHSHAHTLLISELSNTQTSRLSSTTHTHPLHATHTLTHTHVARKNLFPGLSMHHVSNIFFTVLGSIIAVGVAVPINVDDFPSIQAALDAAASRVDVDAVLFHPSRRYDLYRPRHRRTGHAESQGRNQSHVLTLHGAQNLLIDGRGALMMVHDPALGLIQVGHCNNITIQRLILDYSPRPNVQGSVVAVDPSSATIAVELLENDTLAPPIFASAPMRWALIKDRFNPRRQKPGVLDKFHVLAFHQMENTSRWNVSMPAFVFSPEPGEGRIEVGDAYVQLARTNGAVAFSSYSSLHVTFQDIRIRCAPAASYVALNSSNVIFRRVITAPIDGRYHATGADGIFTIASRSRTGGPSVLIEDSWLEALGDDAIILKTEPLKIVAAPRILGTGNCSAQLNLSGTSWLLDIEPGDTLRFFDPRPEASVHDYGSASALVTIPSKTPTLVTVTVCDLPQALLTHWPTAQVFNEAAVAPGFEVRNNTVIAARRWGMLIESRDGVVVGNHFANTSAEAVMIPSGDTVGMLGLFDGGYYSRNITILDNRFSYCYLSFQSTTRFAPDCTTHGCAAVVATAAVGANIKARTRGLLNWHGHRDILLQNNTVCGWRDDIAAFSMAGARDVHIVGNILRALAGHTRVHWGPAIRLTNLSQAMVARNIIYGPFPLQPEDGAVVIGPGASGVTVDRTNVIVPPHVH